MIGQLLGPVAGLASSWLDAKTTKQAAEAKLKLTEAEAKAKILLSEKTLLLIGNALWQKTAVRAGRTNFRNCFVNSTYICIRSGCRRYCG